MADKSGSRVTRYKPRWQLDFSSRPHSHHGADLASPPGYSGAAVASQTETNREADSSLRIKRSWDIALGPFKQVPMNLFMMYMSGNTVTIFPIMVNNSPN